MAVPEMVLEVYKSGLEGNYVLGNPPLSSQLRYELRDIGRLLQRLANPIE
jgi:hypothetical protein